MQASLVIDIGNTSTTGALLAGNNVRRILRTPTESTTFSTAMEMARSLTGGAETCRTAVCSVVPEKNIIWQRALKRLSKTPPLIISHKLTLGFKIDYPRPHTIGPDRLANACAAFHIHGKPVIVVDFGTAVTLDVINDRGCYVGGLIMPGPELFLDYLADRTALLPRMNFPQSFRPGNVIARNTRDAIRAGAILGCRGAFSEALTALRGELPDHTTICATGGYARRVIKGMKPAIKIDQHLTLRGIQYILKLNTRIMKESQ